MLAAERWHEPPWTLGRSRAKGQKLLEIAEEVAGGEMPSWYYRLMHREARLTDAEKQLLKEWTAEEMAKLGC